MIYLDNAATSIQKPACVIEAVVDAMHHLGNAGRGASEESLEGSRTLFNCRSQLNQLMHGESPQQIAFALNSTEALNTAIRGLFQPGDHVITSVMEHNSVLRPLYALKDQGLELSLLPCDDKGRLVIEDLPSYIRPNTKGLVLTHASNLTGNLNPIEKLGQIAHNHGLYFVVDASQSLGAIPIDVQSAQVDVLCFTGHKSMLGPQGTGGLYVRPDLNIRPLKAGGTGIDTYNHYQPQRMPEALEAGTQNGHGLAGLRAAVEYILDQGVANIHEKELALIQYFYQALKDIEGLHIYGDFTADRAPVLALNVWDIDSSEIAEDLEEDFDIAVRSGGHCAPLMHQALGTAEQGAVRFSFGYFTSKEEVDQAITALKVLVDRYRPE